MKKKSGVNTEVVATSYSRASASQDVGHRLDTKLSWFVCLCTSPASLFNFGTSYTYGILFPLLLKEFQVGKAITAIVGSLAVGLSGIMAPLSTKICKRFGCRVTMVCGGLTCAVAVFASSFAPNIYVLFFTYGLGLGFGSSLVYLAGFQTVPLYFDRHRSLGTAIASAGPGIGLLVMTPVVKTLLEHSDWRTALKILAALNLAPSILACTINRKKEVVNAPDVNERGKERGRFKCLHIMDITLLKEPLFLLLSSMGGIVVLGIFLPCVHVVKYADNLGIPSSHSSWMYFITGIATTTSRLLTGKLCDTGIFSFLHIFQCGVLVAGVANLLLPLTTKLEFLLVYSCVVGLSDGLILTSIFCHIIKLFGQQGLGWFLLFICISVFIGPGLAGLIADLCGSYKPVFYTAGTLMLLGACMVFLCRFIKLPENKTVLHLCPSDSELEIFERETVV